MFGSSLGLLRNLIFAGVVIALIQVIIAILSGEYLYVGLAVLSAFVAVFSLLSVLKISTSIRRTREFCKGVEAGDFEQRLTNVTEKGELGEMIWALNGMADRTDAFIREATASMEYVSNNKFFRRILERGMTGRFLQAARTCNRATEAMQKVSGKLDETAVELEGTVGAGVNDIFSGADQILKRTRKMGSKIDKSSSRSVDVAKAAHKTSETVHTIAEATSQLSASITEISSQVNQSADISRQAVTNAEHATQAVNGLSEAASKIGEVVKLITDIAEQTNLLALNATIEAARAGEAGKGFAVVAGEVKNLANQTARATDEISHQVAGIQSATTEAAEAIADTGRTISQIDEIATVIASAVEEQGASTENIAVNMQDVAENSELVRSRIVKVNQGAATSYSAAIQVMWAARDLNEPAKKLDEEVKKFLNNVRKRK